MLHQLAQPYKGQTHVAIETEHAPERAYMTNTLRFGTVTEEIDGQHFDEAFVVHRRWAPDEYEAFLDFVVGRGLPPRLIGNFRHDDLVAWMEANGWATTVWAAPEPVAEPGPVETEAVETEAVEG